MAPPSKHIPPSTIFNCISTLLLLFSTAHAFPGIFKVQRKFAGNNYSISDLKKHDASRRARMLSSVMVPLHGDSQPAGVGLYYTNLEIGTPPKYLTVQVDTGSDILWVNCAPCEGCPTSSRFTADMTMYVPNDSSTSKPVACGSTSCKELLPVKNTKCPMDQKCNFIVKYADQSSANGYFITDVLNYNQVSADRETQLQGANVSFGCASKLSGMIGSGLEGLMGFGQANSSIISQLASSGKVQKVFSHCLDGSNGGGIFAIGNVVLPKVDSTPLIPNTPHYNVNLLSIDVGGKALKLPKDVFKTDETKGTTIDSGSTLAYLPEKIYTSLSQEIFSSQPNLYVFDTEDGFSCFEFMGSLDDQFPVITLHFDKLVTLKVHPHDYFFNNEAVWCNGWQNNGNEETIILGDIILSNKLVVYDLENQAIGWTDYNCSSSIQIKDDVNGQVYQIAHTPSSSTRRIEMGNFVDLLPLTFLLCLFTMFNGV